MNYIEITGKTISEAVEAGVKALGVGFDEIEYDVIDEGSKGFLGIGARPAKVVVKIIGTEIEKPEPKKEVKPEPKQEVKKAEPKKAEVKKAEPKKEVKKEVKKPEVKPVVKETPVQPQQKEEAVVNEETAEPKTERPPLSDEDKAVITSVAENFLKEVFAAMNLQVELNTQFLDNKQISIEMSGAEMGVVIGKRGQTLDSLQYLTNLVVNKGEYPYMNVTLDTEGYRKRRKETLEALAFNLAKKCKHNRKNVVLEPMNPYERRIIHSALQNDRYVTTYSEGVEPHRYVVITMKHR